MARRGVAVGALLVVMLLAPQPSVGRSVGLTARERAALAMAGFLRDSVESVPAHDLPSDGERGAHRSSLRSPTAAFGTRALPLRDAVERPPSARDRARASFPLRDAVERRPSPDPAVSPPSRSVSRPASRPVLRIPEGVPEAVAQDQGWPHNVANPFLAAAGVDWWRPRSALLPSPPYVIPARLGPHVQVWPYLNTLRSSSPFLNPLLPVQPQQRWGLISQPNYVFNTLGDRQEPPVLTYQAIKSPEPENKIVCYLEAWAAYRKEVMSYNAQNVDPFACTHLLYAFASIDPHSFRIVPQDEEYDLVKGGYRAAVGLKRKNPNLKVMLSVGGWMEGSSKFSQMASRADRRREFIRSVVRVLDAHKFDGLDLDWEYPGALDLGGLSADKDHFSLLVDELSEVFRTKGWLLSAAVSPSRFRMEDAYDVVRIAGSLDFINLMAFDLHAERDSAADHHAPITQRPHDSSIDIFYNVDYAVKYWIKRGAPTDKLIVGVPFYGRSFTLKDPARNGPGSPIKGLGKEGRYTQEKGFLSYFEICELQAEGGWKLQVDRAGSPYMVKGDQWVGYEDAVSIANKMAYIRKQKLGGVMIWAVDLDDFQGECGVKTPLLNAVRNNIHGNQPVYAPSTAASSAPLLTGKPNDPIPDVDLAPPAPTETASPTPTPTPTPPQTASPGLAVTVDRHATNCTGTGFAPDPVDCNVYHRCDWGTKTTYVCPEPLHFHPGPNHCDWPELAGCSKASADGTKANVEVNEEVSRVCSLRDGVVADPQDCSRYYWCASSRSHRLRCARGQYFHAVTGLCMYGDRERICQGNHVLDHGAEVSHVAAAAQAVLDGAPTADGHAALAKRDQTAQLEHAATRDLIGEDNFKVACYFTSWASYRKKEGKFVPEHLDPRLCTHIIYAFASLDPETLEVTPFDTWADIENNFYDRITALPDPRQGRGDQLKVILSMGGWTDSTGSKYSDLVSKDSNRADFVSGAIAFLRRHNFKGLQIDWNYPKCWHSDCRKGPASDKPNFTKLMQELHEAFSKESSPLTLAVGLSGYKEIIDNAYDLAELSKYVEYMTVMSYDYHGNWEGKLGHVSPLYYRDGDRNPYYNTNATLEYLVSRGADRKKLLPGIPFYGQSFELKSKDQTDLGDPADGPGEAGEFSMQPGMLAYYEICDRIRRRAWKVGKDNRGATGPYAYSDSQWVSYDDVTSIKAKARFVKNMGFGGAVAWTVDLDDFSNRCCLEPFPLLRAINRVLGRLAEDEPAEGDCTRPPTPVTPVPPTLTTGVDTGEGAGTSSSTWPSWSEGDASTTTPSTTTWPSWEATTATTTTTSTSQPSWESSTSPTTPSTTPTTEIPAVTIASPRPPEVTTTSESPGEVCQSGDYLPDPSNCNAYYRCILGELKKQYCAAGLHWNKEAKVCDWPTESSCPSQTGESSESTTASESPSSSTSTPTPTTSSWTESSWTDSTTPSSTTVNEWWTPPSTSTRPDEWWTPSTSTSTTTTTPEAPTSWPSWQPDSTTSSTTAEPSSTSAEMSTEDLSSVSSTTAAADCINGQYYANPETCEKFFICVNGQKVEQHCASGLVWNQETSMCDWRFNVKCGGGDERDDEIRGGEAECAMGEFRGDPDCTKYSMCVHGELVTFHCAAGLQWNQDKSVCDWPTNSECREGSSGGDQTPSMASPDMASKPEEGSSKPEEVPDSGNTEEGSSKPEEGSAPDSGNTEEGGSESVSSETDGSEWVTWKPTTTTKNPWAWEPTIVTPPPVVDNDPLPKLSGYFKIVCYFTNWAWYRQGQGKYLPEDINPNLCTHIVYGFAVLDYENLVIKAHDSWADFDNKFYERVLEFKKKGKKVSLALGGWNDSAGDKYSRLVNSPSARRRFIKHTLDFLDRYGFDGLDLDWEYPKCWQVNCDKGPDSDKAAFGALVRELRVAFNVRKLLLSAAVSPSKTVIDAGYDVPALAASLDWVAVMTYDYHGQWDKKTGHVAPMFFHPDDDFYFFNANYSVNYWIQEGVPRRKIVMGMPLYGQSFQLAEASTNGLNARAPGPGTAGEFTRAAGFLAYYEICDRVKNRGWTVVKDPKKRMGPYAFHGNQWVSFDDLDMIRLKSQFIRDMDLGGGMIWALDLDDFRNVCGEGRHPLLKTIRRVLGPAPGSSEVEAIYKPAAGGKPEMGEKPDAVVEKPDAVVEKPDAVVEKPDAGGEKPETSPVVAEVGEPEGGEHSPSKPEPSEISEPEGSATTEKEELVDKPDSSEYKVVCYFTNWAWYRQDIGKYLPSNIDANLCTHIVYGFAVLDGDQLTIKPHDSWADLDNHFYEKVVALKKRGIKVTVAIGGWNDSAGDKYSRLVNNPSARDRFVKTVLEFIEKYNFDGLDLDWEYPKCWQVNCKMGPESDKQGFAALVSELRTAFNPKGWLLSAAVSPNKAVIDAGYDVPALTRDMDWIAVMAYDYHGQWDKKTGHVAPMFVHPADVDATFNSNFTINYWISQGADRKKLVLGMPMYGQSFSLADVNNHGLNAPTYGGGEAGDFTRARGFLSYYEICHAVRTKGWTVVRDPTGSMGPYAYKGDQWVSFDDIDMIRFKSNWVREMGLGGGMIWALDLDDFTNRCHCEPYPLLRTINRVLRGYRKPDPKCKLALGKDGDKDKEPTMPDTANSGTDTNVVESAGTDGGLETGGSGGSESVSVDNAGVSEGKECDPQTNFVAHETDCQKYYICQYGQLLLQSCPENLYWSADHCDWPENSKCKASSGPDSIPTTTAEPEPTSPETTPEPEEVAEKPKPKPPKPDVVKPIGSSEYKVVCYYTNWAWYRQGIGKYTPDDIDSDLCTHVTYGFAVLDGSTLTIKPHDTWADIDNNFYQKVVALKKKGVKVSIAIGGWNDSLGDKYSRLVNDPEARKRFIENLIQFIEKYDFDGLDLDWEYPKCWQVNCNLGPESDKQGFASLVRELSAEFKPRGWLLSSAVSPSKLVIDEGYDVPTLSEHFDWIAVMTYDYHGHWDKQTGHVAPLYYVPGDTFDYFNANFTMHYWMQKGADRKKLVMGMPMYGQSFALADTNQRGLNSKAYGPGEAGEFTRAGGFLAYYEICDYVKRKDWKVVRDPQGRIGPYAYRGNQWVSYDDVEDIRRKSKFIKELGLGGGMIWALDLDDFQNRCGCGQHPLLKTINQELRGLPYSAINCT